MGPVESFAWGVLAGSLTTLAVQGAALILAVLWAQRVLKKALWL